MSKASRSPQRRAERVCRKKIKYASEQEAYFAADKYEKDHRKNRYEAYQCGDHWHLTKTLQWTRISGIERLDGD